MSAGGIVPIRDYLRTCSNCDWWKNEKCTVPGGWRIGKIKGYKDLECLDFTKNERRTVYEGLQET